MSLFSYLDDEYFRLQDFLSTLIDTMPILDPDSAPNDKTLVQTLIDQNKVYARKVVSLYQKFNSIYSNTSVSLDRSERASANNVVDRLKEKLNEYEDEIQRLKSENESYSKQLKLLLQQTDLLQVKDSLFTQEGQTQGGIPLTSREVSPNVKKSMNNSFNIPSPIPRTSNLSRVSKDALFDLENMFQSAEYRRAMEILTQLDYEVPHEIPTEKINKWLIISNRIKDSQFSEIFQKLKSLTSLEAENRKGDRISLGKGFEEVLDQQKLNIVDKIYWVLDEKVTNIINSRDTGKKNEESGYQTAYFKTEEDEREDFGLNETQLRQKVNYLKESLNASEMILRDREAEIRKLKEKMRNTDDIDISRKSEGISDFSNIGRVRANGEAKEVKVERDLYRRKYEESIKELDDYKERYNNVQEEADEYRTRYESFEKKIKLISENADKLREENDVLRRQMGDGSKGELLDEREESVENYYRTKPTSLARDLDVADFTGEKAHQRTPTVGQLVPAETVHLKNLGIKGNLLLGNALQVQKNNIYNVKQALTDFKTYISEKLRSLDIESQAILSPKLDSEPESSDAPTEVQRAIKGNTNLVKGITNEIKDLKRDTISIINKLSWTQPLQSPKRKNTETDVALRERISLAEEKLMENLSQTLQSLSKLTASLHEMGDSGLEGALAEGMAEVFDDLQTVHSRIERTIQEFPEFSGHEIKVEGKTIPRRGKIAEFQPDTTTNSLRKKLANDRNDLTSQLRLTLQKFDSTVANDALERLSEEISKNQDLQDIIESKNLLIHRLNMLFSEGIEKCDISVRHLFQLADSEDAQRIVEAILDNTRAFRRTFADANAQYKSPKKRIRIEDDDLRQDSVQEKLSKSRSRSALKSNLKESRVSPERSPLMSKKGSVYSLKWGDKEDRGIQPEEAGWVTSEKQKILEEMNSRCEEWRAKVKSVERENFELIRQAEMLKESTEILEKRNEELKDALDIKEDECMNLARDATRDHEIKMREIEELRRSLERLDRENQELRNYKVTTESVLKRASDQVGHLKLGYFSEVNMLKEENENLEKQRQDIIYELERKGEENAKLNQLIDTLQKFSNKQLETLREKEEKVLLLANQKRESEVKVRELERQVESLAGKNKVSLEKAKESMDDVSNVKYELNKAVERCELSQRELETLTLRNRELAVERDNLLRKKETLESEKAILEDKMKKMSEIVEITKSELRKAHELLELKNDENKRKDREIQKLRESGLQKEDIKEPDYVTYLKRELQARNDELQRVKVEHRRTLDTNEKLSSEIDNLRATSRLGVPSARPSVIGDRNASQQTIRKDFLGRSGEKDLIRKNDSSFVANEQRSRMYEGSYTERPERGASGQKLFTLGDSGAKVQHNMGLAQQKDKEIQRLNQVVKDLTHSLQSSQTSTNSQIKRQIQFSSPQ